MVSQDLILKVSKYTAMKFYKHVFITAQHTREDFLQEIILAFIEKSKQPAMARALEERIEPVLFAAGENIANTIIREWNSQTTGAVHSQTAVEDIIVALQTEFPSPAQMELLEKVGQLPKREQQALKFAADGAGEFGAKIMGITYPSFIRLLRSSAVRIDSFSSKPRETSFSDWQV